MSARILLALVAALWAATSYSQQSRFKITHSINSNAEWAKSILFPDDSSIVLNINHSPATGGYGLTMLELTSTGNIGKNRSYEKGGYSYIGSWAGSSVQLDSFFYVGGLYTWQDSIDINKGYSFPCIIKLDCNYDTVWIRYYEPDTSVFYLGTAFCKTLDGGMLLSGHVSYRYNNPGYFNYFLMKTDTAGDMLWHKTYGVASLDERSTAVSELPNGNILLSGVRRNASQTESNPWVVRLDDTGGILWQSLYTRPALRWGGGYTKPAKTGGFYLMGMVDTVINAGDYPNCGYIARMENNGSFRWLKIFNSKWFTQIWDYYELDNGDVVFCGDKIDSTNNIEYGYIAKIDSLGNLKWWRTFYEKPTGFHYLSCIRPSPDGGYVAVGSAVGINTNSQDAWIIKTDSMGCVIANCYLNVEDIEAAKKGIKVYPNPATNEVNVSVSSGLLGEGTVISAYDMSGRRMVRVVPDGRRQKATINTREWVSGIYIIAVQRSNGDITTTKITVVK